MEQDSLTQLDELIMKIDCQIKKLDTLNKELRQQNEQLSVQNQKRDTLTHILYRETDNKVVDVIETKKKPRIGRVERRSHFR